MKVVVVGGGLAGLAAAVRTAQRGFQVTLLEARSFCGGRAYSFREPKSGVTVDNGQHLLMGCYQSTLALLDMLGTQHHVELQRRFQVPFAMPGGTMSALKCPSWPPPLHFAAGLLRWRAFPKRDLWSLRRAAQAMQSISPETYTEYDQQSIADWLDTLDQGPQARKLLWEPLVLAVMNETPERASLAPFLMILREGLMTRGMPVGLGFPKVGLSELFVAPALAYLEQRGHQVHAAAPVEQLLDVNGSVRGVACRNGAEHIGDAIILALPPRELMRLMERHDMEEQDPWCHLRQWESAPILSVHLWYDRPVLRQPMVGLTGSRFHWAFDKSQPDADRYGVALVSSACRAEAQWSRADVVDAAKQAMHDYFPAAQTATLVQSQVTKELHATVSVAKGSEAARLKTRTLWPNLFLAGDWTQTYLPATIEGAVRSGFHAAEAIAA